MLLLAAYGANGMIVNQYPADLGQSPPVLSPGTTPVGGKVILAQVSVPQHSGFEAFLNVQGKVVGSGNNVVSWSSYQARAIKFSNL
jgi:hypothetical protein